jgi:hypothetical protein
MRVYEESPGVFAAEMRSDGFWYVPVRAHATVEGIAVDLRKTEGEEKTLLQLVYGPEVHPPGSDATVLGHNYWLFRQPTLTWRLARRAKRQIERAGRTVERLIDRVVRSL